MGNVGCLDLIRVCSSLPINLSDVFLHLLIALMDSDVLMYIFILCFDKVFTHIASRKEL